MTCGWFISNYAKLRRHVGKRRRRSERERERKQRVSIGSVSDACREEKSTRLEITINLRGRPRHSKLIRFESINKKLNVTRIVDYMPYTNVYASCPLISYEICYTFKQRFQWIKSVLYAGICTDAIQFL